VSGREPVGGKTAAAPAVTASSLSFESARALGNVWTLTELWKELGFTDLRRVFRRPRHAIDVEALIRIILDPAVTLSSRADLADAKAAGGG
jgi:hypothetical protein